jgi:hypothetical protein
MQFIFNGTLSKIVNLVRELMHWCTFLRHVVCRCTEYISPLTSPGRAKIPDSHYYAGRKDVALSTRDLLDAPTECQMIAKIPFFRYGHRLRFIRHAERLAEKKTCLPLAALWFQIAFRQVKTYVRKLKAVCRISLRGQTMQFIHQPYNDHIPSWSGEGWQINVVTEKYRFQIDFKKSYISINFVTGTPLSHPGNG